MNSKIEIRKNKILLYQNKIEEYKEKIIKLQNEIKDIESIEFQKILEEVNIPIYELKELLKKFKEK
ncbi:MAG: hypothetical protein ACRCZK_03365 [Oscillospiraceae bacterium]